MRSGAPWLNPRPAPLSQYESAGGPRNSGQVAALTLPLSRGSSTIVDPTVARIIARERQEQGSLKLGEIVRVYPDRRR